MIPCRFCVSVYWEETSFLMFAGCFPPFALQWLFIFLLGCSLWLRVLCICSEYSLLISITNVFSHFVAAFLCVCVFLYIVLVKVKNFNVVEFISIFFLWFILCVLRNFSLLQGYKDILTWPFMLPFTVLCLELIFVISLYATIFSKILLLSISVCFFKAKMCEFTRCFEISLWITSFYSVSTACFYRMVRK